MVLRFLGYCPRRPRTIAAAEPCATSGADIIANGNLVEEAVTPDTIRDFAEWCPPWDPTPLTPHGTPPLLDFAEWCPCLATLTCRTPPSDRSSLLSVDIVPRLLLCSQAIQSGSAPKAHGAGC